MTPVLLFQYCFMAVIGIGFGIILVGGILALIGMNGTEERKPE